MKEVELDEIEMLLGLFKESDDLSGLTCSQIAKEMQSRYQIQCSEEDIFLLHEPDVYDVWYEDAYYYKNVLGL